MLNLHQLLKILVESNGSDLHITTNSPPQIRVDGKLTPMDFPPMNQVETKQLCYSVLTDSQKHKFEEDNELDLSFGVKGLSRFRGNVFIQRGAVAGVFRVIPYKIMTFEELGLPPVVPELASKSRGLILVTGPTGSGKSTTLASIIDYININRHEHIVTIEDPIEYLHPHKGCLVNQREVGADTKGFKNALRYVLRQDPDVVQVGELRDLETIEAALTLSETGHLCLATLLLTGLFLVTQVLQGVASPRDFLGSPYGRALGVKLALATVVLVLGGVLGFVLAPRLVVAIEALVATRMRALGRAMGVVTGAQFLLGIAITVCVALRRVAS